MALTRIWCLKTRSQDSTIAVFADETVYGGAENDRNEEAHYVLIAKVTENQILTFIANVDNTDPLNTLEYTFTQSVDGFYRLIEFVPPYYSGGAEYTKEVSSGGSISVYPDIIWHPGSASFYTAIGTAFTAIEPSVTGGWAAYWRVSTEADFQANVSSNKGVIVIHDDVITFRLEDCLVTQLDEVNDDLLCGICAKWEDLFDTLALQLMLDGANSNNWQNKQTRSEIIILGATKEFCC